MTAMLDHVGALAPQLKAVRGAEIGVGEFAGSSRVCALLQLLCGNCHIGLAAVVRLSNGAWRVCALHDKVDSGLEVGDELDMGVTLVKQPPVKCSPDDYHLADLASCCYDGTSIHSCEVFVPLPVVPASRDRLGVFALIERPCAATADSVTRACEEFALLLRSEVESWARKAALEEELRLERASSELREQFIAVLGHDLRDPLLAIFAWTDTLAKRASEIDVGMVAGRIHGSAKRMSSLVDDVLDYSRGRLASENDTRLALETNLESAFFDVVLEARTAHPDRTIEALCKVDGAVRCDRSRLQQLLANLVGNAVRHGAASEPIIVASKIVGSDLEMSVSNGGARIEPEHIGRIFEPYWRPPSTAGRKGLGLGLHICSQIAAAHGGRMEVSSTADGTTRFTARMPIAC